MNLPTNTEIKMNPSIGSNFAKDVATSKTNDSLDCKVQIKIEQKEEDEAHLVEDSSISDADQLTFECEINEEIKLEQEELIIKDEPQEAEELGSLEIIKFDTNPPTLGIRDCAANTEIKVDPSISRVDELLKIYTCDVQVIRLLKMDRNEPEKMNLPRYTENKMDPSIGSNFAKDVATSKTNDSLDCKVQIKIEQKEEDEAHLVEDSSISDVDQLAFECQINEEIKLEQEELIIKDEPQEVEEMGSLEIIKYDTNPPTLGIRDRAANTEIKVDSSITRIEELLVICTCDIQVMRLPEQMFKSKMERYLNFNLQDYLEVHKLIHENKKPFKCQQCGKGFSQNYNLKPHMLIHENKRPFQCQQCGRGFNQSSGLKAHIKGIHENKRPFKCQQCDKGFNLKSSLRTHMLFHENERPFKCSQCDKTFTRNYNLKEHMLFHENKKPFKCKQCNKKFRLKGNLKGHMLLHENKRPFNCQWCDKGFTRNNILKAHMLFHENKRPFKCSQCNKGFNRNSDLNKHMLIHENKRPFKCQRCDKGFNQNTDLKTHMLTHENKTQS